MVQTPSSPQFGVSISRNPHGTDAALALIKDIQRQFADNPIDLVFLFFSSHHGSEIERISTLIRHRLTPHCLLGAMGEGVIAGSEEVEEGPAISMWAAALPKVRITPIRLTGNGDSSSNPVPIWPQRHENGPTTPVFLIMADPFTTPMNEILSALAQHSPGSPVIGGLSSGAHQYEEHRLVLDDTVFGDGLVGVALSGPVSVRPLISQGCRPLGERYIVTKAQRNVVMELSGKPALAQLESLFESLPVNEQFLAQRALHVGLVINEHRNRFERGDFLVRNLLGADKQSGSLVIGDIAQEGQTFQFHVRDAQSASEDLRLMMAQARSDSPTPPRGALVFSCCGRGQGLFGKPHHDISVIRQETGDIPIGGFFAQGEIGPVGGNNFLHGYTASVALFSESGTS